MSSQRSYYVLSIGLTIIALALLVLTSWTKSRELIRNLLFAEKRILLAKTQGDLTGQGMNIVVLKVKTADSLSIEIYDWDNRTATSQFRTRIILPERRDAFFNFHGNAVNLALEDVDNDRTLEIIAPTFDENLISRLNIYKYNEQSGTFDRLGPDAATL